MVEDINQISTWRPILIQKMVKNADRVHKVYHTFEKVFYKVYNTIEYNKCQDLQFFDGYKDLKYSTQDFTKNTLF
jgi:hypothetical protein